MVALRKESVDRNSIALASMRVSITSLSARRAWIEIVKIVFVPLANGSLSARRAWIEISMLCSAVKSWAVALRKESVDRNDLVGKMEHKRGPSLSARRAWIEI